jgi:hypothetical protein
LRLVICFFERPERLARGALLSFVSPKESKQRKCDDGFGDSPRWGR